MTRLLSSTLVLALAGPALAQSPTIDFLPSAPRIVMPGGGGQLLLAGGSDQCSAAATADAITGTGSFTFDNTAATTGPEGQFNAACAYFNNSNILQDVWFSWTAPAPGGLVELSTCGQTAVDTKVAVYASAPCASLGAPLSCNDDISGALLESKVFFQATAGSVYLIQLGLYPGQPAATPGTGAFTLNYVTIPCSMDDGSAENATQLTQASGATQFMWLQRFGQPGATTTISAIQAAYGAALAGTQVPAVGTPVTLYVFEDPNDDGNPTDGVQLAQVASTVQQPGTDMVNNVPLTAAVSASGYFFVAVSIANTVGTFPAPWDNNSCGIIPRTTTTGVAWLLGNAGPVDATNLGANSVAPFQAGTDFAFLLRATCSSGPVSAGMPFCFGDGSGAACPCANNGAVGNGCASSINANGGNLAATGTTSLTNDTVVLAGSGMTNTNCLYFQGTAQQSAGAGVAFGDGKRCAGGQIVRLKTVVNVNGSSQYPQAGDPPVSVRGLVMSPGIRTYQVWYRNAAAFCTPDTFNLTNGFEITWAM
jgi:hypothetical protein